jgi:hypothetical protein
VGADWSADVSKPYKIDRAKFNRLWCELHADLSGVELGLLMGVDQRTARQYFSDLGVARTNVHTKHWTPRDCKVCERERACSFEVRRNGAALCEVEDADELDRVWAREKARVG